jgi:hypothetical protein
VVQIHWPRQHHNVLASGLIPLGCEKRKVQVFRPSSLGADKDLNDEHFGASGTKRSIKCNKLQTCHGGKR